MSENHDPIKIMSETDPHEVAEVKSLQKSPHDKDDAKNNRDSEIEVCEEENGSLKWARWWEAATKVQDNDDNKNLNESLLADEKGSNFNKFEKPANSEKSPNFENEKSQDENKSYSGSASTPTSDVEAENRDSPTGLRSPSGGDPPTSFLPMPTLLSDNSFRAALQRHHDFNANLLSENNPIGRSSVPGFHINPQRTGHSNGGLSGLGSHRRLSPGLSCLVCGDTSSGKHYGILACNGCSGFFKRSVRRRLIYRCQAGTGDCVIDKAHRNQCQACRLRKCLVMGMNKDAVQNERQPRNTATIRPEALAEMDQERFLREAAVAVGVFSSRPSLPLHGFVTAINSTRNFLTQTSPPFIPPAPPHSFRQLTNQDQPPPSTLSSLLPCPRISEANNSNMSVNLSNLTNNISNLSNNISSISNLSNNISNISNLSNNLANISNFSNNLSTISNLTNNHNNNLPSTINHNNPTNDLKSNFNSLPFAFTNHVKDERTANIEEFLNLPEKTNNFGNISETAPPISRSSLPPNSRSGASPKASPGAIPSGPFLNNPAMQLRDSIQETAARILFMAVKWARNLPSFNGLAFKDQISLLEDSWAELFIINAIQWSLPLPTCPLLSPAAHAHLTTDPAQKTEQFEFDIRHLNNTANDFRELTIDPAEFAYLKAIVLFRNVRGAKDAVQIESLQDQAQIMLSQHERTQYPNNPARFGKLLILLGQLRVVSSGRVQNIFFKSAVGSTPMENIIMDMYKN